jgi:hypothetical protein
MTVWVVPLTINLSRFTWRVCASGSWKFKVRSTKDADSFSFFMLTEQWTERVAPEAKVTWWVRISYVIEAEESTSGTQGIYKATIEEKNVCVCVCLFEESMTEWNELWRAMSADHSQCPFFTHTDTWQLQCTKLTSSCLLALCWPEPLLTQMLCRKCQRVKGF